MTRKAQHLMFIPPGREDWKQLYSKHTINRNQDKWFYQMSEYLWDAQSALHEGVWTILMSAPSKSFTTCCNLKSKEFDFCNKEERDSQLELFQNAVILSPCNMSWGWWSALVPNVQTLASRTALADLCFLLWIFMFILSNSYSFLIIFIIILYLDRVRHSNEAVGGLFKEN